MFDGSRNKKRKEFSSIIVYTAFQKNTTLFPIIVWFLRASNIGCSLCNKKQSGNGNSLDSRAMMLTHQAIDSLSRMTGANGTFTSPPKYCSVIWLGDFRPKQSLMQLFDLRWYIANCFHPSSKLHIRNGFIQCWRTTLPLCLGVAVLILWCRILNLKCTEKKYLRQYCGWWIKHVYFLC